MKSNIFVSNVQFENAKIVRSPPQRGRRLQRHRMSVASLFREVNPPRWVFGPKAKGGGEFGCFQDQRMRTLTLYKLLVQ